MFHCCNMKQEPCYRRDHRAMRPDNNVSTKLADDCARISTLRLYLYMQLNYFRSILSNAITAPNSDLNVTDGQTDRRTLRTVASAWHHRATRSIAR